MKRFEFSLDRLLRVKRQLERLAELEQQRAQKAVEQARAALLELQDQLARISDRFSHAIGRPMTPQQWVSASDMADRLGKSIQTAEQEVTQAEQKLIAAAQERALVATEVEAITILRRQQWEQWQQEARKADQERLDEVSLRLWQNARDEELANESSASSANARAAAVA